MHDYDDSYQIPEGGVVGAFNSAVHGCQNHDQKSKRKVVIVSNTSSEETITDDLVLDMRLAEIETTEDVKQIPTRVLEETLVLIDERHQGDEPTTEQDDSKSIIEKILKERKAGVDGISGELMFQMDTEEEEEEEKKPIEPWDDPTDEEMFGGDAGNVPGRPYQS